MKKMNQRTRGETCGTPDRRYRVDNQPKNVDEHWARRRGERQPVAGGSLEELERKLALI
jgi:hypothetical protein